MKKDTIRIRGARQHNLQNVDLEIPKNQFIVFTGVSGSGKSSLAFDTIYAEGQRRYVESLSAYARQFLGIMDKPDVDLIEGLSPSISIDQKTVSHNPRSTVGTITEVYDYLRLLFARIGLPHCPSCLIPIARLSTDEIVDKVIRFIDTTVNADPMTPHQFPILAPIVRERKGEFNDLFENIRAKGYVHMRVDGVTMSTSDDVALIKTNKHNIEAIIDTLFITYNDFQDVIFKANIRSRLSQAIEQSTNLSDGLVIVMHKEEEHLYSERLSCPTCNFSLPAIEPRMFSFNSPIGACSECKGIGTIYKIDPDLVMNPNLSINEGGIMPFSKFFYQETWYTRLIRRVCEEENIDLNKQIGTLTDAQRRVLLYGTGKQTYRVSGTNRHGKPTTITEVFPGIINELEQRHANNNGDIEHHELNKYMREEVCPSCKGARLKPEVLAITIDGLNINQMAELPVHALREHLHSTTLTALSQYALPIAEPVIKEINTRLSFLYNVGLSYLTISRAAKTLSGGELQRIRLASQIGTGLTGVLYVLDEPSIGLHPRDVSALIKTLHNLKNIGNTLIVVEHDQETMESADYMVELGPYAGKHGGHIICGGTIHDIKKHKDSLTGQFLSGKRSIHIKHRDLCSTKGKVKLIGAKQFSLKNIDLELPLGNLICITGVSGSGKSTLIVDTLYPGLKYQIDGSYQHTMGHFIRLEGHQYANRVYLVDQSPIGRTPRSNPATYVGLFDEVRDLFAMTSEAKMRGFTKSRFSFNLKGGRCEKCEGAGVIKIEMQFLSDVYVTCDVCNGKRYNRETLEVTYKGKRIDEVLSMTVDEAADFFHSHPKMYMKLSFLQQVGLGYIHLGQSAPTFSGGEAQRIKLAFELSRKETGKTIYILDEPTTGLHFYDVEKLLNTLHELVDRGNTVIIIEHNLDVIKNCQYIVDLGPEGGDKGGEIVYQGPIKGILDNTLSHTARYLKNVMV